MGIEESLRARPSDAGGNALNTLFYRVWQEFVLENPNQLVCLLG